MFTKTISALTLAFAASSVSALTLTTLPSDGDRVFGSSNIGMDQLFLSDGGRDMANDFNNPVDNSPILAFNLPSNFMELERRVSTIVLPDEDDGELEEVGELIDVVFSDINTDTLIFATRIELEAEELFDPMPAPGGTDGEWAEAEINDILRSGFSGSNPTVGWTRETSADQRMVSAALSTASGLNQDESLGPVDLDPNTISMNTDINGEEGNPFSGWFLIATDATSYILGSNSLGLYQAGEEDQDPTFLLFDGFIPEGGTPSSLSEPTVVPVPAAVWLLGSALIGLVGVGRRNKS